MIFVLVGDCKELISYLNSDLSYYPWSIKGLVMDCKEFVSRFDFSCFSWMPKGANRAAHVVASHGLESDAQNHWSSLPSVWLEDSLSSDVDHILGTVPS